MMAMSLELDKEKEAKVLMQEEFLEKIRELTAQKAGRAEEQRTHLEKRNNKFDDEVNRRVNRHVEQRLAFMHNPFARPSTGF